MKYKIIFEKYKKIWVDKMKTILMKYEKNDEWTEILKKSEVLL